MSKPSSKVEGHGTTSVTGVLLLDRMKPLNKVIEHQSIMRHNGRQWAVLDCGHRALITAWAKRGRCSECRLPQSQETQKPSRAARVSNPKSAAATKEEA